MDTNKEFRKSLYDIIIKQISRNNEPENAYKCFNTLNKVVGNIIESPHDKTKRQLKKTNKIVKSTICEIDGGADFLIKIGFRVKVIEFQKFYILEIPNDKDSSQLRKQLEILEIAQELLKDILQKLKERSELKERAKLMEKIAEESRKEIALKNIEEDRKRRAEEQERLKRHRKFQMERELKEKEEQQKRRETEEQLQQLMLERPSLKQPSQEQSFYRSYHPSDFNQRFEDQGD
ncbi:2894_t:CDS:1 [Scutellospora calospora]|uniref:2894_t:CDS:1 n=1 Tax=Scutellospora calospora TaxID=85575 RepID=A0ACA9MLB9_9GLOM|nr:2894_t:CDS:1 [Scutellospora calospora]